MRTRLVAVENTQDNLLLKKITFLNFSNRVPSLLDEKCSRSFPAPFQNFLGAFGHSLQQNIKRTCKVTGM